MIRMNTSPCLPKTIFSQQATILSLLTNFFKEYEHLYLPSTFCTLYTWYAIFPLVFAVESHLVCPEGPPNQQNGYGGPYAAPRSHFGQEDIHTARPEGYAPHLRYPPLMVPIYPCPPPNPFGYPMFTSNYPMYSAPNDLPSSSPTSTQTSSYQSNPPFLPPRSTRTRTSRWHTGSTNGGSASSRTTADRTHSHKWAPPPPPSNLPGMPVQHPHSTRITGRYGIHELLNCQLDSHPFIDWVIHNDLSLARQWVIGNSGTERCQSVGFDTLAVVPPVNNLCIRTTERGRYTPLGQAIQRWGDIRVCRFDRFLGVGDVLHEIWAYFHSPLTEDEKASMQPRFSRRVEVCFQKRWNAQGGLPEQAVQRRCDTLLGCVRFAGLEIGIDFETCRELYLSLEDANLG